MQLRGSIICILVGTLLGVLTTVLAAWTCALEPPPPRPASGPGGLYDWKADGSQWHICSCRWRGSLLLHGTENDYGPPIVADPASMIEAQKLPYWSLFRRSHRVPVPDREKWYEYAHGWPFLSLVYRQEVHCFRNCTSTPRASSTTSAITLQSSTSSGGKHLPVGILWRGFLADTALVTPFWIALPLWGAMLLKRIRRLWRGRCDWCGYDLRGNISGRCPECGHRADSRWSAQRTLH